VHYSLIPFAGSCLSLYLIGTLMMTVAFVLDKKNARKFGNVATGLFCGGYLFTAVASILTVVAFFIYFTNGGI
jgi:hypothetical protein